MNVRERTEEIERLILSIYAALSQNTGGREINAELCNIRTEYQRDRDKIIHSKSFRRLKHKTQVFISPQSDHYRTRLTHTLEVSQIARTIARGLRLNEDLTEAIALGHDLGHTPFGHAGEKILNEICPYGFSHNLHSLRVVEKLENGKGLNLTFEVKDGIINHRTTGHPNTLEGRIVQLSDKFAYINHDIDDAIRAGIITISDLPKECVEVLGDTHSKRIDTLVEDAIERNIDKPEVVLSKEIEDTVKKLRTYMFENLYIDGVAKAEVKKVEQLIETLYNYLKNNPNKLPFDEQIQLKSDDIDRVVCDYIAGMTDGYAIKTFSEIYIPKSWQINNG